MYMTHRLAHQLAFGLLVISLFALLSPASAGTVRRGEKRLSLTRQAAAGLLLENPVSFATLDDITGEWLWGINGGDPLTPYDDGYDIVDQSQALLFVDGVATEFLVGAASGNYIVEPWADVNSQTAGFTWETADTQNNFQIKFDMQLVRGTLKWSYAITNKTNRFCRVGFRMWHDIDGLGDPAVPYFIPKLGLVDTIEEFKGSDVPDQYLVRYGTPLTPSDYRPPLMYRQLFTGFATRPERLVFGTMADGADDVTSYGWPEIIDAERPENALNPPLIHSGRPLDLNTFATAMLYPILSLENGQTRVVRGQYELNSVVESNVGQIGLGVRAPEWISYRTGDDPTTTDVIENGYYSPSQMDISAFVCNSSKLFESTVNVAIDCGKGFELVAGQQPSYSGSKVLYLEDKEFRWRIRPTGAMYGPVPIKVTLTAVPGGTTTTTVYVNVPALPQSDYQAGIHFIGVPFEFPDSRPSRVFTNFLPDLLMKWWDPLLPIQDTTTGEITYGGYRDAVTDEFLLSPGRGYWVKWPAETLVDLQNATPVDQKKTFILPLSRGWNAISNPYQYSIVWGLCTVIYNYNVYTLPEAIRIGLIRPEIWSWDSRRGQYNPPTNPSPNNNLTMEMKPFEGFWIYAGSDVELSFSPNPYLAVMDANQPTVRTKSRTAGSPNQWKVNIVTEAGGASDILTSFGVGQDEADGLSAGDVMKPPMSPAGLQAYFPHSNWGRMSGSYAVDMRAPSESQSWTMEVQCTKANERVTVRWPDLTSLPAKVPVILTDETTGQKVYMRTSPSYSYNSGTGGIHRFTIAYGGSIERLQITQLATIPTKGQGILISYNLTIPADVKVRLRTPTGRLVRTLVPTRAASGLNSLSWDGRDAKGQLLPAGMYLCELYAESPDGQRVRSSLTLRSR